GELGGALVGDRQAVAQQRRVAAQLLVLQQLQVAEEGRDRRPQLVRDQRAEDLERGRVWLLSLFHWPARLSVLVRTKAVAMPAARPGCHRLLTVRLLWRRHFHRIRMV